MEPKNVTARRNRLKPQESFGGADLQGIRVDTLPALGLSWPPDVCGGTTGPRGHGRRSEPSLFAV